MKFWDAAETGRADLRRPNKYHAQRCACDQGGVAHQHDSLKERTRCFVLHQRQALGEIRELTVQGPQYECKVNGVLVTTYRPDFTYYEPAGIDGSYIVEDVKPTHRRTRDYELRRKLMWALHRIVIRETT